MKKVWILSGIAVFVAIVTIISITYMSDEPFDNYGFSVDSRGLPEAFANFELYNEVEEDIVNELMTQLHGKEVELDQAFILEYGSRGGAHVITWISESNIEGKPEKLLKVKHDLVTTNQLLANFSEKTFSGQKVYYGIDARGVDNYFFVSDNRFLFIQSSGDNREVFIKNAVRIF